MNAVINLFLRGAVLLVCAAVAGGLASLLGLIESDNRTIAWIGWGFDLLVHFQIPYAVAILALAPLLALRRLWKSLAAVTVCAVPVVVMLWPYVAPVARSTQASVGSLTIVGANLWFDRIDPQRLRIYLRDMDADIVVLNEASARWLTLLSDDYPYRISNLSRIGIDYGVVMLSRHRIEQPAQALVRLPSSGVVGRICPPGGERHCVTVVGMHTPSPLSLARTLNRDRELRETGALLGEFGREPLVLAGDLNTSPWSRGFRALLVASRLSDSSAGTGLSPTWNIRWPAALVPIDHILHSAELRIVTRRVGPDLGSDHLPVIARLSW